MAQEGQPREDKLGAFSGCFCVVMGFILGNIFLGLLVPAVIRAITSPADNFPKVELRTSRAEVIALLGRPKAESGTNPFPPNSYEHQDASRHGVKSFLMWQSRRGKRFFVGLDAQEATVFKASMGESSP